MSNNLYSLVIFYHTNFGIANVVKCKICQFIPGLFELKLNKSVHFDNILFEKLIF